MQQSRHYPAGTEVEVFYRLERDGEGYFPVDNYAARCLRPRFGMTDGWVKAKVLEAWPPPGQDAAGTAVRVIHTHPLWADRYGQSLDPQRERDMAMRYPPCDVRPLPAPGAAPWVPTLSLLVVRWGGQETEFNVEQWGSASASTSSAYISAFVDSTIYKVLGPDYEVISIFVTSGHDLARLGPAAVCPMMRGRHRAACYFLWPVMHQACASLHGVCLPHMACAAVIWRATCCSLCCTAGRRGPRERHGRSVHVL